MAQTIFPYASASYGLKLANLSDNIFKLSGEPRKDALLQLKRYSEQHNIDYDRLIYLFNKNITFYQNQFAINNPSLTSKQLLGKQTAAFNASIKRAVSQNIAKDIQAQNPNNLFIWLPSTASDPRDTHQQLYGGKYSISNPPLGVLPGEDYNCQCGMQVLNETNHT